MNNTKLIMESWRKFLKEDTEERPSFNEFGEDPLGEEEPSKGPEFENEEAPEDKDLSGDDIDKSISFEDEEILNSY